ncbi:SDR family oxidoreductase [Siminovitchia acidinfaciens]|uniref:SDR family oxidoreductase n=1 Tax=Siminovitchia acidinfaciens TaxID=2321395 RepID=A0A429XV51_9BACI|nr:SDR family NAD(P)-dependent oxidoreductase [Siminovitchia acidinfaciens]RST72061.1 SDR family oxidoreductase [Siminovitchia acidinfaciens]
MSLKEKVAVITGAGSGIGKAIALKFAEQGAKVVIAEINEKNGADTEKEIKEKGFTAEFIKADVSSSDSVKSLIYQTVDTYGTVDILVNNAGLEYFTTIEETTEEQWDRTMNINLKGVFLGTKFVLPIMREKGKGNIINIASVTGLSAWPGLGIYSASKGGVVLLTKATAAENGKYGIRVNSICPGIIQTPLFEEQYIGATENPEAVQEELFKQSPLKTFGDPADIADAAVYLAGNQSRFVTGHSLVVDGGLTSFVGELI